MSGDTTDHRNIILNSVTRLLQFLQLGFAGLHLCVGQMEDGFGERGGVAVLEHYLLLVFLLLSLQGT